LLVLLLQNYYSYQTEIISSAGSKLPPEADYFISITFILGLADNQSFTSLSRMTSAFFKWLNIPPFIEKILTCILFSLFKINVKVYCTTSNTAQFEKENLRLIDFVVAPQGGLSWLKPIHLRGFLFELFVRLSEKVSRPKDKIDNFSKRVSYKNIQN